MLSFALKFFDKLLEKLFLDPAAAKMTNAIDARNVRRQINQAADIPAQTLSGYFQTEGLEEGQITAIFLGVEEAITRAEVNADMLASVSLDAEKLTTMLLDTSPLPVSLQQEDLDFPYRMALKISGSFKSQLTVSANSLAVVGWRYKVESS